MTPASTARVILRRCLWLWQTHGVTIADPSHGGDPYGGSGPGHLLREAHFPQDPAALTRRKSPQDEPITRQTVCAQRRGVCLRSCSLRAG